MELPLGETIFLVAHREEAADGGQQVLARGPSACVWPWRGTRGAARLKVPPRVTWAGRPRLLAKSGKQPALGRQSAAKKTRAARERQPRWKEKTMRAFRFSREVC